MPDSTEERSEQLEALQWTVCEEVMTPDLQAEALEFRGTAGAADHVATALACLRRRVSVDAQLVSCARELARVAAYAGVHVEDSGDVGDNVADWIQEGWWIMEDLDFDVGQVPSAPALRRRARTVCESLGPQAERFDLSASRGRSMRPVAPGIGWDTLQAAAKCAAQVAILVAWKRLPSP